MEMDKSGDVDAGILPMKALHGVFTSVESKGGAYWCRLCGVRGEQ